MSGSRPVGQSPGELAGRTIDVYRVDALLGRGGMGEVYKAEDVRLRRPVALKIVNALQALDGEFVARFEREARAASALNHPNVAQVYFYGRFEDRPYYAMEYVEGRSLAEILRAEGRLSGRRCLALLEQACAGLMAALEQGIIHRDIKPANLMVDTAGMLKIVDFGLARRLSKDDTLTQTDSILGTPRYMSPEQATAAEVDHRSDVYSLGATFYHLFAGAPPFEAETPVALMMKHVNEQPAPLKSVNPRVPAGVCTVIEKMLAKRPEDRYQRYEELLADLRLVGLGRAPRAELPVPSAAAAPRAGRTGHGPRAWELAAIVAFVGFAVVLVAVRSGREAPQAVAARPGEPPSSAPAEDRRDAPADDDRAPAPRRGVGGVFDLAFRAKTLAVMRQLSTALQVHFAQQERLPETLAELRSEMGGEELETRDAWNREIVYQRPAPDRFRLVSAGPDGAFNSPDDIIMSNGRVVQGEPSFGR